MRGVTDADNDVVNGIRRRFKSGAYRICRARLSRPFRTSACVWDARAERGEDKPLKKDDHTSDMERYDHTLYGTPPKKRRSPGGNLYAPPALEPHLGVLHEPNLDRLAPSPLSSSAWA